MIVKEREWTDQFGTHYAVSTRCPDKRIYAQKVTKLPDGWPPGERERAYTSVMAASK